jgi:carbon-monoxide dehydrogenase medium subunit
MALGARVVVVRHDGERVIALDDFFTDYYQTALQPDEVVTQVLVPPRPAGAVGAYTRFLRTAAEHRPLVGYAVAARLEAGACRDARIVVGASTPIASRARKAEAFLEGKSVSREVAEQAASIASQEIEAVSDFRGTAEYRREMVRVAGVRTLAASFGLAVE